MWAQPAEMRANLTLLQDDGKSIQIHRIDPEWADSAKFAGGNKNFTADYTGTIENNIVRGTVIFNGDAKKPREWHGIIDESGHVCTKSCLLNAYFLGQLGKFATISGLNKAAFACYRDIADTGIPLGYDEVVVDILMNGNDAVAVDYHSAFLYVAKSIDAGNWGWIPVYTGMLEKGLGVEKNPEMAAKWRVHYDDLRREEARQMELDRELREKIDRERMDRERDSRLPY